MPNLSVNSGLRGSGAHATSASALAATSAGGFRALWWWTPSAFSERVDKEAAAAAGRENVRLQLAMITCGLNTLAEAQKRVHVCMEKRRQ